MADRSAMRQVALGEAVRRHTRMIAAVAVVFGLLGLAYTLQKPVVYRATASVLVSPLVGNPFAPADRGQPLLNMSSEAQLVRSDAVVAGVQRIGAGTPLGRATARDVSVAVPANSQIVSITYGSGNRVRAKDGANAFARAYLDYRRQRASALVNAEQKALQGQIASVERSLRQATLAVSRPGVPAADRTFLNQRINVLGAQLTALDNKINDIGATAIEPGVLLNPAGTPTSNVLARALPPVAGLVGGLLIGLLLALLWESRAHRVRRPEDLAEAGVPVLATVDDLGPSWSAEMSAPPAEAFRRLRVTLLPPGAAGTATVLVSAADPDADLAPFVLELAKATSRSGLRTAIVDATPTGRLSELAAPAAAQGLTDVLLDAVPTADVLVELSDRVVLVPAGRPSGDAADALFGQGMLEVLTRIRERNDLVVVAGPWAQDAGAYFLAGLADRVVVPAVLGHTSFDHVAAVKDLLDRCPGDQPSGLVLAGHDVIAAPAARPRDMRPRPDGAQATGSYTVAAAAQRRPDQEGPDGDRTGEQLQPPLTPPPVPR